jgi:CheY-like chemotaxis protein
MLELIMCIDDDPITLMLFKKTVKKASFANKITNTLNGQEAIQLINTFNNTENQEKKPQLIFLDLNMPVMDGWEFLDLFNASNYFNKNNTKVIILTSTIDPEDIKKAKSYPNVIEFLSKPITVEILNYIKTKL